MKRHVRISTILRRRCPLRDDIEPGQVAFFKAGIFSCTHVSLIQVTGSPWHSLRYADNLAAYIEIIDTGAGD
jgi:hypothetical protein